MTKTTRTRLAAALLACGVALAAVPLAQALAEPTPPAPPARPAPPRAPDAPRMEQHIVIVNTDGNIDDDDDDDEAGLNTRVVTRDGKTFVFKTKEKLSDAELERRVAEAEAAIPPVPPVPPVPGVDGRRVEKRVIVRHAGGDVDVAQFDCDGKDGANIDTSAEESGKKTRVKIRVCGDGEGSADEALQAVRDARARIASDVSLSDSMRAEILGQLDAEIARLEHKAG